MGRFIYSWDVEGGGGTIRLSMLAYYKTITIKGKGGRVNDIFKGNKTVVGRG